MVLNYANINVGFTPPTLTPLAPVDNRGTTSALVDGHLIYELDKPCYNGAGPYLITLQNPDFQSINAPYVCSHPAPRLITFNETVFMVGFEGDGLVVEFADVQPTASLTVYTSGANAQETLLLEDDLDEGAYTFTSESPCFNGQGIYFVEVTNPDQQNATMAYSCQEESWNSPRLYSQSKDWVYTQSSDDTLTFTGEGSHEIKQAKLKSLDSMEEITLCDNETENQCNFSSHQISLATPANLTPNMHYEIVFTYVSAHTQEDQTILSNIITARAPKAEYTVNMADETFFVIGHAHYGRVFQCRRHRFGR